MFCSKCGKALRDGAEFCSACGAKVSQNSENKKENSVKFSVFFKEHNSFDNILLARRNVCW